MNKQSSKQRFSDRSDDSRQEHNLLQYIALQQVRGLGPLRLAELLRYAGSVQAIYDDSDIIKQLRGVPQRCVAELRQLFANPEASIYWQLAQKSLLWAEQNEAKIVTLDSPHFPTALRELPDCPIVLHVLGDISLLNRVSVAIVGSRNASSQGLRTAREFAGGLADCGINIVSGMALGIDSQAHVGALDANGFTTAVWATGLDQVYPATAKELAAKIIDHGAVISEMPLGTTVRKGYFPRRNRIISGLSQAVLVVEAAINSGSLITARYAAEQGRDVLAVPGSIHNPMSKGCHRLIKQGACLVETIEDVLNELQMLVSADFGLSSRASAVHGMIDNACKEAITLTDLQRSIYNEVEDAPTSVDLIAERCGEPLKIVLQALTDLELAGMVVDVGGNVCRA